MGQHVLIYCISTFFLWISYWYLLCENNHTSILLLNIWHHPAEFTKKVELQWGKDLINIMCRGWEYVWSDIKDVCLNYIAVVSDIEQTQSVCKELWVSTELNTFTHKAGKKKIWYLNVFVIKKCKTNTTKTESSNSVVDSSVSNVSDMLCFLNCYFWDHYK
jgi:hypothetical protein